MPLTKSQPAPLDLSEHDDLRPVSLLARELTGRRPSPATIWRWCVKGTARAGRLPALTVFGSWHSTREALVEWLRRGSERSAVPNDPPADRPASTERRLKEAGLL